jgi:hypothetical protein
MGYEYKIVKIVDGNNEERFVVRYTLPVKRWWKKSLSKKWMYIGDYYNTIGEAQAFIKKEIEKDRQKEYARNRRYTKVVKEYLYTDILEYIPEEQQEKFCDIKGANL